MGRNNRRMKEMSTSDKIILYSTIGVIVLAVIITALFLYSKNLNDEVKNSTMSLEDMANLTNNTSQESENKSESASTEIGKSVEEAENEMNSKNNANSTNSINSTNTSNSINSNTTFL